MRNIVSRAVSYFEYWRRTIYGFAEPFRFVSQTQSRFCEALVSLVISSFVSICSLLTVGGLQAADVPSVIGASGKTAVLSLRGVGAQIFECRANEAGRMFWQFREPTATLFQGDRTIGRHFAGPTWELADGSAVVGKVVASSPGFTTLDVSLLKLDVAGRTGQGGLSKITTVQRLGTHGGIFAGPCDHPGEMHAEPYSAEYVFLGD
jgi:hypothetical protein